MPNQKASHLANLKQIIGLCSKAWFIIQTILMDIECNKIIPELPEYSYKCKVERCIRVIKERCSACMSIMHNYTVQ